MTDTSIQIFIAGEEVVCDKEIEIKEEFLSPSSTILNNVYPKSWETDKDYSSRFYFPKDYSSCKIYRNGILYFSGIVKNSGDISLNPRDPKYASLQVLDYKTLLSEGKTLDIVIANKTVSEAIQLVIDEIADYGFELGTINILNNPTIEAYSTLDKTAYDVFQYLSEISQSRWTTRMVTDNMNAIDFFDPLAITTYDVIDYTTSFYEANNIVDISSNFATRDYRNKQVVLSELVYGNINSIETVISNGYGKIYGTEQPIGAIVSIFVNSVEALFATNAEKELGVYADFYYTPGEMQFSSNEDISYIAGTEIDITYTPLIQGREVVYDNNEINRIKTQTSRNGTIARYETRNDILKGSELNEVGQAYIKYKGKPEIKLNIVTQNNDFLTIGQIIYFNMPDVEDLATTYMVKTKTTFINQTADYSEIFYTYELSSNFEAENAINYFDNQRRKSKGNISGGQFIIRNVDVETQVNLRFQNLTTTEITVLGDNILDCILDSPFNN